jgi:hypothetical protein
MLGAFARTDAKEDASRADMKITSTNARSKTTVLHISVDDSRVAREQEQEQPTNFALLQEPVHAPVVTNPAAPMLGRQEQDFLGYQARAREIQRGEREEGEAPQQQSTERPEVEDEEIAEGFDGDLARHEIMEGVFSSMMQEEQARDYEMFGTP